MSAAIRHETRDCGGVKLHCAIAGEMQGEPGAPLILFLHGFPEFWAAWREPMAHFAARGWLAVAPDLRGYMNLFRLPEAERVLQDNGYARLLGSFGHLSEGWRKELVEAWSRPGALTGGLNYYRASPMYPPTPDDPGAAKLKLEKKDFVVRVPTLVLWGERDTALLTGCIEGLDECVPDLRVVRVPDASHWIVQEKPELVCSEIEGFLKG